MGDRTYVRLTVLKSQAEKAKKLFDDYGAEDEYSRDPDEVVFGFSEVNYGTLDFLDDLRDAGIAYDSSWEDGGDYTAGTASCRFTDEGDCVEKEIYDESLNPDLGMCMDRIDKPEELRKYIIEHNEKVRTLPFDNQEEYGKIYQAKKLISP